MKPTDQRQNSGKVLGFAAHDHGACVADALRMAEAHCRAGGLRLTPVRHRVLEILLEAHAALGAYEVLARLAAEGLGSKPPVAYRALGFLVDNGLAHRIERLNAYVACARPGAAHDPAFLICRTCGSVAEASAAAPFRRSADASGFKVETTVLEAEGLCPACQQGAAT
ncbi:MAG TPA: Fur family transcriptional regulator [Paracoccaceae bacterium]|nr:Fur family transcriptional regulator [Paracoccaceae bacterium]